MTSRPLSNPSEGGSSESERLDSNVPPASQSPGSSAPVRSRLAVDKRRAQLLKLGQELFSNFNYDELSIDEIARRAGISKGLLYHYFPSKRDYYVEVIRAGASELLAQAEPPHHLDGLERLAVGLDGYLDYVQDHAKPFASLLRTGIGFDPEVANIVERTRQAFLGRVLEGIPDEPSPQMRNALRGWIGFVEGAVLDWLDHQDISRLELRTLLVEMAMQNIILVRSRAVPQESRIQASSEPENDANVG